MKRYNIINNSLGWLCFLIAAVTYLLTIEPTASFWDCPEFISQGFKLEVGHPPGNPIFILAARFFINFVGNDPTLAAVAVNVMSALLSAATILLLFWTITHFVRRMIVGRSEQELSLGQMIAVMGSGLCGALVYTWSDTFWFSAVEGEVYAFSSFCTALVVWLIVKWDNCADRPHADRYLILVAYVIGVSIAVHLLNLLTIPALALVVFYRKSYDAACRRGNHNPFTDYEKGMLTKSLGVLALSFVVVALILYGLVPGFVENAQYFELFFVNVLGMNYNFGVLVYSVILLAVLIWCIRSLYLQKSALQIRISFILSVVLSGIPFIGDSLWTPLVLTIILAAYMFASRKIHVRILTLCALSILVIFVGYSSYALLLIRSSANPPMNQNAPDNVFALSSYLNREQYGETPLLYGPSFASTVEADVDTSTGDMNYRADEGKKEYGKIVKTDPSQPDKYVELTPKPKYRMTPKMIFPRMYSTQTGHPEGYMSWIGESVDRLPTEEVYPYYDMQTGDILKIYGEPYSIDVPKPSFAQNMRYFLTYQLNYMYWRYFMWNFAGRQNDYQGQGELNRGNWISGIPFIDNPRLGDQSLLPDDFGKGNKGHNVFYMLPLLMGLLGIAAQMVRGSEGVKQFWVVFFLFFMTGIAIVLYLNQPPFQPRERDYAFAGSFYAFSIWVGMGVYGLWLIMRAIAGKKRNEARLVKITAIVAAAVGLFVPLQMVSQTWDDHDRSGRYTTRDFGMNYLSSLDENAVIFTNGDNDTFPLWYAQEVEGYRTDVRVVNLAYLTTDWYANHTKMPANDASGVKFQAQPADYAFDRLQYNYIDADPDVTVPVTVDASLHHLYQSADADDPRGVRLMRYPNMYFPVNVDDAVKQGIISAREADKAADYISVDLSDRKGVSLGEVLSLDIIANGSSDGWSRPTYFAMTVPDENYLNMSDNLRSTGLAYQVNPIKDNLGVATDKMYDNIVNKFRWGGLDTLGETGTIYLDETVRRMVTTHRSAMLDLATALYNEGVSALYYDPETGEEFAEADESQREFANDRFNKAVVILDMIGEKLPVKHSPYAIQIGDHIANLYAAIARETLDNSQLDKAIDIYISEIVRYVPYINYYASLLADENRSLERAYRSSGRYLGQTPKATLYDLNLSRTDLYVPYYLYTLIQDYVAAGGDVDRLEEIISKQGGPNILATLEEMLPEDNR